MSRTWWPIALAAAAIVALAACGGDGGPDSLSDAGPAETGVTFPDRITVPAAVADGTTPTTAIGAERELTVSAGAPRGFPGDFPRPDDAQVLVGSSTIVGENRVLALDLTTAADLDEVVAFFRDAIDDAEFAVLFDEVDQQSEPPSANLRFETDDYVGDVLLASTDAGTSIALTATLPSA